jgi:hypothetical protein
LEVLELDGVEFAATGKSTFQPPECLRLFSKLRRLGGFSTTLTKRLSSVGGCVSDGLQFDDAPGSFEFRLAPTVTDMSAYDLDGASAKLLRGLAFAGADSISGTLVLPSPKADATHIARYLPLFTCVRRLCVQRGEKEIHFGVTGACVAALLRDMPALTALELGYVAGVAFAGAAYDGVCAPGLRELVVARVCTLRDEGIATIVRVCPNLRALDIRGCRNVTTKGFVAAVLEAPPCAGTVTGSHPRPNRHQTLRLRKLRRVVASLRWPLPRALNFVQYHPGFYGSDERLYMLGLPAQLECNSAH